jgi:hypothetical protein
MLVALWLPAPSALACTRAAIEPFRLDPTQVVDSSEGPSAFREVTALSYRIEATRCSGASCTESTCGDSGMLLLRFEPPAEAPAGQLGYRVVWLGGVVPPAIRAHLEQVLPLDAATRAVAVELPFDGVPLLDGELALVAVDRAGRESELSDPVHVSWSGCTEYFDDPYCVESGGVSRPERNCAVVNGPRSGQTSPLAAASAAAFCAALLLRWSRRKRCC